MTSIVLHPAITAAAYTGSPVLLRPPWRWWHTRAHDNHEHGHLWEQLYTGELERPAQPQDQITLTFGRDWDTVVLTDPPSMRALTVQEWPDIARGDPQRSMRASRDYMEMSVVWHECPGPDWHGGDMLRPVTCRPGDYRLDSCAGDRHELLRQRHEQEQRRDFDHRFYGPGQALQWPLRPTIRGGRRMPIDLSDLSGVLCLQCRRSMSPLDVSRALQLHLQDAHGGGVLCDECANLLRRGHLTVNEVRMREGLPPLQAEYQGGRAPVFQQETVGGGGQQDPRCRPEQRVLDDIEELVNEELTQTRSGYDHNISQEHCPVCGRNWHGLPGDGKFGVVAEGTPGAESYPAAGNGGAKGCPGAFADEDEIAAWRAEH